MLNWFSKAKLVAKEWRRTASWGSQTCCCNMLDLSALWSLDYWRAEEGLTWGRLLIRSLQAMRPLFNVGMCERFIWITFSGSGNVSRYEQGIGSGNTSSHINYIVLLWKEMKSCPLCQNLICRTGVCLKKCKTPTSQRPVGKMSSGGGVWRIQRQHSENSSPHAQLLVEGLVLRF